MVDTHVHELDPIRARPVGDEVGDEVGEVELQRREIAPGALAEKHPGAARTRDLGCARPRHVHVGADARTEEHALQLAGVGGGERPARAQLGDGDVARVLWGERPRRGSERREVAAEARVDSGRIRQFVHEAGTRTALRARSMSRTMSRTLPAGAFHRRDREAFPSDFDQHLLGQTVMSGQGGDLDDDR